MTALAAEVIWTRILSLLYGGTVYTFSLILAVFLFGLGIGSSVGSALARNMARPRLALAWVQMLLAGAIAWAAYMLTQSLPYWPIDPSTSSSPWFTFQLDLVRSLWAMLPAAILWGASFPLALASVANGRQDPARLVGGVYAANTVGAIVGSLTASLLLVVWVGSQRAQQLLIVLSVMSSLLALDAASAEGIRDGAGARPDAARRHAPDRRRRDARGLAGAQRRRGARHPRRLRPLRRQPARSGRRHRHARRLERVDRRDPAVERRPELSQRRQGPGVERAAGHAAPAHARPHDDADSATIRSGSWSSGSVRASPPARSRSSRGSSRSRSPRSSRSCR